MVDWTLQEALLFTLLMIRTSGLMMFTPFFGSTAIPARVRVMVAVLLAYGSFATMPRAEPLDYVLNWTVGDFALNVTGEMVVGAAMGLVCNMLFSAVQFAGQIIDQQLGFAMSELVDPFTSQNGSITGQFQFYIFIVIFLLIDGHLQFLSVFLESISRVPLGYVMVQESLVVQMGGVLASALEMAVRFAAPILFLSIMINIALGFISRAVPTMNVFIIGFPVKIMMGVGLMMVALGQIMSHVPDMTDDLILQQNKVVDSLRSPDG